MPIKSYHIAAEIGGPPLTLISEMAGNANTIPNKNGNLFAAINPGDVIGWLEGTISLKCAGELFWQLNAGPTGAASDPFLCAFEFINALAPLPDAQNAVTGRTYQVSFPIPASWSPMGPVIAFNFQYYNYTSVTQASGFEIQLNLFAS
jgi:hypothetical protein